VISSAHWNETHGSSHLHSADTVTARWQARELEERRVIEADVVVIGQWRAAAAALASKAGLGDR